MPQAPTPLPITPPPGIVVTETDKAVPGRYTAGNMVRFIRGKAEKRGGWMLWAVTQTLGTPRASHSWRDNTGLLYLGVGTFEKLYVYDTAFAQNDITPFRVGAAGAVTLTNNPLSTTISSPSVGVFHTAHGLGVGDFIYVTGATAIGGITPNGTFNVVTVVDANNYTFNFTSNATTTVAAGGGNAVAVQYEINIGVELGAFGYGYGVGPYGLGTYGTARSTSTIFIEPRIWSLDHFGKLLLSSYNGGSLYQFDPTQAQPWPRTQLITNAPTDIRFMFVTPEQYVIALRAGMVVHGCNQGDFNTWTPATNNTAFLRTLTTGTKLVGGRVLAPFISLIWSDSAVFLLQWTGSSFVYNTSLLANKCGLVGANAAATAGGIAYWMSADNFWMFDGSVHPIFNVEDIRHFVFNNATFNLNNSYQCSAVYNPIKNEVEFFYTLNGQTNPTVSVIFHIDDKAWSTHTYPNGIARASGTSPDQGDTRPLMAGTDGYIYQHENGVNANGVALPYTLSIARWAAGQGRVISECQGFEPDFINFSATMQITISGWDRLNDAADQTEPLESDTEICGTDQPYMDNYRVSGRYLGLTFSSSDINSNFRMGAPVAWVVPIGQRP